MILKNRHVADAGAIALTVSLLFSGVFVAGSAHAAPASTVSVATAGDRTANDKPGQERRAIRYVALGDSYAAGFVAAPGDTRCQQSDFSYPEVLDDLKRVKLVANASCSGAETTDVVDQLSVIKNNKPIDVVTITVGANDLNVAALADSCLIVRDPAACAAAQVASAAVLYPVPPATISVLAQRLSDAFTAVAAAAPGATILVTGYPYLFDAPPVGHSIFNEIIALRQATTDLNATIAGVVAQLDQTAVDIRYVDVTAKFAGHGIGSAEPWIIATGLEAFHPNKAGFRAYAEALAEAALLGKLR